MQAVGQHLGLVAAGDDIDQEPAVGQAVEGRRHAHRQARRRQPGAHGHQEFEPAGFADQAGRDHPGVFAGTAGGQQHAFIAQRVGRHRDLAQVVMVDRTRALRGAEVTAVAVGREEPENIGSHVAVLFA